MNKTMKMALAGVLLGAGFAGAAQADQSLHMIVCGDNTTGGVPIQAKYIKEWEAQNPGYTVNLEFVPWGQCQQKSITLASAGNPPALAYMGSRTLKQLAENDLIEPMNLTDEEKASYAAPILGTVTWKGQAWGLPRAFSTKALFYNKKIFEEAGLDPSKGPETFDELVAMAKTVTEKTDVAGYGMAAASFDNTMHQFLNLMYSNGGQMFDADGKVAFDSKNNLETMQLVKKLVPYSEPGPVAYNRGKLETLFAEGKIAMLIDGHWLTTRVPEDIDFGIVPVPHGTMGHSSSLLITDSLAVFKNSGVEKEALSLAKFLTSPEHQMAYDIGEGNTPIRTGPEVDALIKKDPTWKIFVDMIPQGGPEPFVSDYSAMQDVMVQAIQGVVLGEEDPKDAVADAADGLEDVE